eukprot:TRINITY_DN27693_c1_g1_i2.p2 TRINITY_DN27693_c1_g1~~TRINITY_DN27693_c1_g1_i2.p2  ORF type:complete len:101 (+),score=9.51 TRINITY_DN27693_c1_g1_i2:1915-2217(+)
MVTAVIKFPDVIQIEPAQRYRSHHVSPFRSASLARSPHNVTKKSPRKKACREDVAKDVSLEAMLSALGASGPNTTAMNNSLQTITIKTPYHGIIDAGLTH